MNLIKVTFRHPTDGSRKTVELDSSFEAKNIIALLIENEFVPSPEANSSYVLMHKSSSSTLRDEDTLEGAGVSDGDELSINIQADAGS